MSAQPIGIGAMNDMADDTGGRAFVNTNDLTGAVRQAIEDSAITYTRRWATSAQRREPEGVSPPWSLAAAMALIQFA